MPASLQYLETCIGYLKGLSLVHTAVNNCGPMYLCDLVSLHKPTRFLRSAEKHLLARHRTRCKVGDMRFVAPTPDLPVSLCELTSDAAFKMTLKVLYFNPLGLRILLKHATMFPGFNFFNSGSCMRLVAAIPGLHREAGHCRCGV